MNRDDSATKQYSHVTGELKIIQQKDAKYTPFKDHRLNFIKVAGAWFKGHKTLLPQSCRAFMYTHRGRILQTFCALLTAF